LILLLVPATTALAAVVPVPSYDVKAASQYLGVNHKFVRRLVAERAIPYYRLGRLIRVHQG
jgi:excisionase family DNA binding protein